MHPGTAVTDLHTDHTEKTVEKAIAQFASSYEQYGKVHPI